MNQHLCITMRRELTLMVLLIISSIALALEPLVEVDRTTIEEDETLTLTVQQDTKVNISNSDLTNLKNDFDLVGQSEAFMLKDINGKTEQLNKLSFVLKPKKTGKLTIPSLQLGSFKSKPIEVTVTKAKEVISDNQVFIKTLVSQTKPYVQSAMIYTAQIYIAKPLDVHSIQLNDPESEDFISEPLDGEKRYTKEVQGQTYHVVEKYYLMIPKKAGSVYLPAFDMVGTMVEYELYDDSFFGIVRVPKERRFKRSSEKIELQVKPIPNHIDKNHWYPAQAITIQEQWHTDVIEVKVGEPIARTLHFKAVGLHADGLPRIEETSSAAFKTYLDKPEFKNSVENGQIISEKTIKINYIPVKDGVLEIPAIVVRWFNTKTENVEEITLPSKSIKVLDDGKTSIKKETDVGINEINHTEDKDLSLTQASNPWKTVTLILLGLWLISLLGIVYWVWLRKYYKTSFPMVKKEKSDLSEKKTIQAILTACKEQNASQVEKLILSWAHKHWRQHEIVNLHALASKIKDTTFRDELRKLDACLFSSHAPMFSGEAFAQAFQNYLHKKSKTTSKRRNDLPPLNPNDT